MKASLQIKKEFKQCTITIKLKNTITPTMIAAATITATITAMTTTMHTTMHTTMPTTMLTTTTVAITTMDINT
jgi:hypothetical protein